MAQPPFRSDAIQIEGDGPGTRMIECAEADGSLLFTDPQVPGGVKLFELAGLQRAQNTIVVTPDGLAASKDAAGNPITTIQAALDAVPSTSGALSPWTILIGPGNYYEDLLLTRSHVTLVGLGGVGIYPASDQHTLRILQGSDSTPFRVRLQTLTIGNGNVSRACVALSTAQFATGSITVATNPNVGDTVTIDGVVLTAISGPAPAPGEFTIGTLAADTATNLVTAISDPVNALTVVRASSLGSVVNLRASEPGVAGNAITLASSVPLILVISAPTLTGGVDNSNGSQVGSEVIELVGCDLVSTGVNSYQVLAQAVNNIRVLGGSWSGSGSGSFLDVRDCASLQVRGVLDVQRLEVHYDSTAVNLPIQLPTLFELWGVETTLPLNSSLQGGGDLVVAQSKLGNTSLAGDRTFTFQDTVFGTLFVGGTSLALLRNCVRGTLTGDPTALLNESRLDGSVAFVASVSETVTFAVPRPNLNYAVVLEQPFQPAAITDVPAVVTGTKTTGQFNISFGAAQTTNVRYVVLAQV